MRILSLLAGSLLAGSILAAPPVSRRTKPATLGYTEVLTPAQSHAHISITKGNTLNGTSLVRTPHPVGPWSPTSSISLPLVFVNNIRTGAHVYAYVSGIDRNGKVVFLKADGTFLYPSSGGSRTPVPIDRSARMLLNPFGQAPFRVTVPAALLSARVYFCDGDELDFFVVASDTGADGIVQPSVANLDDPNVARYWGFMEFTFNMDGSVFSNLSNVDFVGLILSISMQDKTSNVTQITRGLGPNAARSLCRGLIQQATNDGQPWNKMCIARDGNIVRVLSPGIYQSMNPDAFAGYYEPYVDEVWQKYSQSNPLQVDTQRGDIGTINCYSEGDALLCDGSDQPFFKPNATDIWGCNSGPFALDDSASEARRAIVPRLCAAFVRSTLLAAGGGMQPGPSPSDYYKQSPSNHYSRLVHSLEIDGKGYAFPYDDVNPNGAPDASGSIAMASAKQLTIYVGGSG